MTVHAAPPRLSRGRAAALVVTGMAGVGVVIGGLWAWLAPSVNGVIALNRSGERVQTYLGGEADHFFVAAFMMLGMLWAVSVVAPVLVWQWRAHRGPLMVTALSLGSIGASAVATASGGALARLRYPPVDIDTAPVSPQRRIYYFTEAPSVFFGSGPLQMAATLLVPAATAALVYAVFAVATIRDDLGGYPPVEPPRLPAPVAMVPVGEHSALSGDPMVGEPSAVEPRER
ncbi:MAG: DUF2567 domain-containing protein [Mycobacterium sp.]